MSKGLRGVVFGLAMIAAVVVWGMWGAKYSGPPAEVFGAKRSFCQEGPAATCCGYDGVDHEGDPCGIVLCRGNGDDEWHIVMARCFRQKSQSEQPPKTEGSL